MAVKQPFGTKKVCPFKFRELVPVVLISTYFSNDPSESTVGVISQPSNVARQVERLMGNNSYADASSAKIWNNSF